MIPNARLAVKELVIIYTLSALAHIRQEVYNESVRATAQYPLIL